jgi:hypothetical protein
LSAAAAAAAEQAEEEDADGSAFGFDHLGGAADKGSDGGMGMDVEESTAVSRRRSGKGGATDSTTVDCARLLSALRFVETLIDGREWTETEDGAGVLSDELQALICEAVLAALTAMEAQTVRSLGVWRCVRVSLGILESLTSYFDVDGAGPGPRVSGCVPRISAALTAAFDWQLPLQPQDGGAGGSGDDGDDDTADSDVADAAADTEFQAAAAASRFAEAATSFPGELGAAARVFADRLLSRFLAGLKARDAPHARRHLFATAVGDVVASMPALLAPSASDCIVALLSFSESLGARAAAAEGGGDEAVEEEDEEVVMHRLRARCAVLTAMANVFRVAKGLLDARPDKPGQPSALQVESWLGPYIAPIAATIACWLDEPTAFTVFEDDDEEEDGVPCSVAMGALLTLLMLTMCCGAGLVQPHVSLRMRWVQALLDRAGARRSSAALRKLAEDARRGGLPA